MKFKLAKIGVKYCTYVPCHNEEGIHALFKGIVDTRLSFDSSKVVKWEGKKLELPLLIELDGDGMKPIETLDLNNAELRHSLDWPNMKDGLSWRRPSPSEIDKLFHDLTAYIEGPEAKSGRKANSEAVRVLQAENEELKARLDEQAESMARIEALLMTRLGQTETETRKRTAKA